MNHLKKYAVYYALAALLILGGILLLVVNQIDEPVVEEDIIPITVVEYIESEPEYITVTEYVQDLTGVNALESEIDGLNSNVANLQNQISAKLNQVASLQSQLNNYKELYCESTRGRSDEDNCDIEDRNRIEIDRGRLDVDRGRFEIDRGRLQIRTR